MKGFFLFLIALYLALPVLSNAQIPNATVGLETTQEGQQIEKAFQETEKKEKPDKFAVFASQMMFYGGVAILGCIIVGMLVFAYKLIPKNKKAKTCPIQEFANAKKIVLPLPRGEQIVIKSDNQKFSEFISHFTAELKPSNRDFLPMQILMKIKSKYYGIEISLDGWNFINEEPNIRVLRNPIEAIGILDSLKEEYLKLRK